QAEWIRKNPERARRPSPIGTFLPQGGRMRQPAEDGPIRRVPDDFQAAVLDGPALRPLVATKPEIAREVLLAVCIEEPRREDPYNDRMFLIGRCGLDDWRHGYPAMYWKGPFLAFLRAQPKAGLEAIIRLVNHATTRWLDAAAGPDAPEERRSRFGFEFTFGGRTVVWSGDANVFGW